jgi:large subunit ribosomal protein L30e
MADELSEIKNAIKGKKIMIGTDKTIKALKLGKLSKVFLASNASEGVMEKIERYSKLTNTKVIKLKIQNDELGSVCKKPFSISVLSILKGA